MTVETASTYAYAGLDGTQTYIEGSEVLDLGLWSNATTYAVNDVVSFGNALYICLQTNLDVTPNTDPAYWSGFVIVNRHETQPIPPSAEEINALYKSDYGTVGELRSDDTSIAGIVWVNQTADDGSQEGAFFRRTGSGPHDGVNRIVRYDLVVYSRCF